MKNLYCVLGLVILFSFIVGCDEPSRVTNPDDEGNLLMGNDPPSGSDPVCKTYKVTVNAGISKCPRHTRGDREFAGHGPEIWTSARLQPANNGRVIQLVSWMKAQETQSDWTTAEQTWTDQLVTIPYPYEFKRFVSDTSSSAHYIDTDHSLDRMAGSGTLVRSWAINGDTGGNDVGNCTTDDAYMTMYFNEIRYEACTP